MEERREKKEESKRRKKKENKMLQKIIGEQKILQDWSERGFYGGLWGDPPGQIWKDYVHDADELFMAIDGEVELEISGKKSKLKIGEEILIPARAIHSVKNAVSIEARCGIKTGDRRNFLSPCASSASNRRSKT